MAEYEYLKQRISLDVDLLGRRIDGVAEIILAPKCTDIKTLRLHARQLHVSKVSIDDIETTFTQYDFLNEIVDENYRDADAFDLFYRGSIVASKEGELAIDIPKQISLDPSSNSEPNQTISESESGWCTDPPLLSTSGHVAIRIRIEYFITNPRAGVRFIVPDSQNALPTSISPHMYTFSGPFGGLCDGARTWMPCRDTLRDTCTFRLDFHVPTWCLVICSGSLVEQLVDPTTLKRIFRYALNKKTSCSSIGFAVGPFRVFSPLESMPQMTHFALPQAFPDVSYCCSKLSHTMEYLQRYLNASYPFKSYHQIFVYDPPEQLQYFAGASIIDQQILHSARIIDRELPSHLVQAKGLIGSWISGSVGLQTTKAAWVLVGVVGYILNTYVRAVYGEEEHGYRIQLAMDALTTMELTRDGASLSLLSSEVDVYAEYVPSALPFLEVKAPLVLHMIEQRVGPQHLNISLQRVVASTEDFQSISTLIPSKDATETTEDSNARSDEKRSGDAEANALEDEKKRQVWAHANEPLTTSSFLKTVKAIAGASGQDLTKSFLSMWIVDSGMPFFTVGYWYNRKQTQAEVVVQQEVPPGGKLYTGAITVTIVEDTSEYTYQKRIESRRHKWDFPCHSKVRKKRRRRQGLSDLDDSVSVNGPGMGLNDTPVFWVKIDTGQNWLRHIVLHQPDFNWMEQLLSDKKVGSRVHAARALALFHRPHEKPNIMSCRVLTECMSGLTTHSRRLRAEAALSLGVWQSIHAPLTVANTSLPIWKAMHNLFRIFKEHFFDRNTDMPLPNYFVPSGGKVMLESLGAQQASLSSKQIQIQDYAAGEYEIKKSVPRALAMIRAQNEKSPPEIEQFLLQLLCENDNSKNYVKMDDQSQVADDCFYIGSIVLSLSLLNTPAENRRTSSMGKTPEDDRVVQEILRYLRYDQVQPSHGKIITVCCLEALCNLILAGRCDQNAVEFFSFASPKHIPLVRRAAIESILRLFFSEDPDGPSEQRGWPRENEKLWHPELRLESVYGATAALLWLTSFLKIEESPGLRLFAVQVCLNCMRGFPPASGMLVLATWDHSYTLRIMHTIQMSDPTTFILKSPQSDVIQSLFVPPVLQHLREDRFASRWIAECLWDLMNVKTGFDQRLRVALLVIYRKIWGDATSIAVAHTVQEKAKDWAGGFESLRVMMEEIKSRSNGSFNAGNYSSGGKGREGSAPLGGTGASAQKDVSVEEESGVTRSFMSAKMKERVKGSN
uniref:Transcription initiation factor TFIID subunit 2 n=1 Tax=Albugo laibachii Nc14 TaxID=890382 RepID=F0WCV4_9STRA|nr:transcription initiation factor TFIID subunit putati [Albugo laibachii Nc14]|eukprot:CCA19025.1 transcription initiation factor TFIID subunit putati [Albugo laibachii Nc14]